MAKGKGFGYRFLVGLIGHQGNQCVVWPLFRDKCGRGRVGHNGEHYWAHRLMCQLARGDPPTPKHTAAHNCGKGHEGCVNPQHLEWKTQKDNLADCITHGTQARHTYGPGGFLKADQVQEIREARGARTQLELARHFGVSEGAINDIWRGRTHAKPSKIPLWTDDEERKLREAIALGKNFREIAAHVGTKSMSSVMMKTYRLGLQSGRPPNPRTYAGNYGER